MAKHNMVSLKRAPLKGSDISEAPVESFFPLSLFVNGPEIEKLGLGGMEIGEEHELIAKVKVTSISVNEREGLTKHESVELTLLEGEVNSDHGQSDQEKGEKLFGKGK